MDSFFPSYCSVCDKTIDGCCGALYCSNVCRMRDSLPNHKHIHQHNQISLSTSNSQKHKHTSNSNIKPLSLNYPSVFGTPLSPSHFHSFADHQIPKSLPELSLSEDEETNQDDFDIPEISLGQVPIFQ